MELTHSQIPFPDFRLYLWPFITWKMCNLNMEEKLSIYFSSRHHKCLLDVWPPLLTGCASLMPIHLLCPHLSHTLHRFYFTLLFDKHVFTVYHLLRTLDIPGVGEMAQYSRRIPRDRWLLKSWHWPLQKHTVSRGRRNASCSSDGGKALHWNSVLISENGFSMRSQLYWHSLELCS